MQPNPMTNSTASRPINRDEMAHLIAWKREHRSWSAIETAGLEPERVEFARHLVQSGRIGEGR